MWMFYLIISVISIDRFGTSNTSQHRPLFQSSCQGNDPRLKSSLINSSPTKSSLIIFTKTSPSSFSLLSCEHHQTTSYSSSGFAILYSSPSVRLLNTASSPSSIPANHADNASRFHLHQSFSSSTLMSSNENNRLFDSESNTTAAATATLIHSLLSTTSTTAIISNVSLHQPTEQGKTRTWNLTLLIGCLSGTLVLIIILVYALMKYRNRDEGSYKIDESQNFLSNSPLPKHDSKNGGAGGGKPSSAAHHRQKLLANQEPNGVDSREWYV